MQPMFFIDIGELGWSLYLSAHVRYLINSGKQCIVVTSNARKCLYPNAKILDIPKDFHRKYGSYSQEGFGLFGASDRELKLFFSQLFPHTVPAYFKFKCAHLPAALCEYAPYSYSKQKSGSNSILILPRHRITNIVNSTTKTARFETRNCTKHFYIKLIDELLDRYPEYKIISIGSKTGAYDINHPASNYTNMVGQTTIQDVIDLCQDARLAIGSTSSLPKITLLQNVPTFVIGHERERIINTDNWLNSPVGFYEINKHEYQSFDESHCVRTIVDFAKEYLK